MRIATRGCTTSNLMPEQLSEFLALKNSVAQQHFVASDYNIELLRLFKLNHLFLLLRDPRDVLVSWYHHITRPDVPAWERNLYIAEAVITEEFYEKSTSARWGDLIFLAFPKFCVWIEDWLQTIESRKLTQIRIIRFTDLAAGGEAFWADVFSHINAELIPPKVHDPVASKHFRSGLSGVYKTEFNADQIQHCAEVMSAHPAVAAFF